MRQVGILLAASSLANFLAGREEKKHGVSEPNIARSRIPPATQVLSTFNRFQYNVQYIFCILFCKTLNDVYSNFNDANSRDILPSWNSLPTNEAICFRWSLCTSQLLMPYDIGQGRNELICSYFLASWGNLEIQDDRSNVVDVTMSWDVMWRHIQH